DTNDRIRLTVNLNGAADKIAPASHSFPEAVAGHNDRDVCVRFAFFRVVKATAKRLRPHHRKVIFRRQKGETTSHLVISSDSSDGDVGRGQVGEHVAAVIAQLAIFVVGKLPVIVTRVLAGRENVYHLFWPKRHNRMKDGRLDHSEDGRVDA